LTAKARNYKPFHHRRGGRAAEGGGLLNRYTLSRRIKGSNPFLSANSKSVSGGQWQRRGVLANLHVYAGRTNLRLLAWERPDQSRSVLSS